MDDRKQRISAWVKAYSLPAFLLLVVAGIFLPILGYEYVWDDKFLLSENPYLKRLELLPAALLADYFQYTRMVNLFGYYRPIPTLTFFMEYHTWGVWAPGSHLVNLVLHLINGVLVMTLARAVIRGNPPFWIPYLVGGIFLVVPVNVEPVAWISGRPELLAAMGVLGVVLLEQHADRHRGARAAQAAIFFLALCCKEVAVIAPFLAWGFHPRQRPAGESPTAKNLLLSRGIPFMAAMALYLTLRMIAVGPSFGASMLSPEQIARALVALGHYVGLLVFPVGLTINTRLPGLEEGVWFQAAVGAILILVFVGLAAVFVSEPLRNFGSRSHPSRWNRHRWILHDMLWLTLPILPATLVIPRSQEMPDRYLYMTTVGLSLLLGRLAAHPPRLAPLLRYLPVLYLMGFAFTSAARVPVWQNDLTLWADAVSKDPQNSLAQLNYGVALRKAGRVEEANEQYLRTIEIEKAHPPVGSPLLTAYFNLGNIAREEGRYDEALEYYRNVLKENPAHFLALTNVGVAFLDSGRSAAAEEAFKAALGHSPQWIPAMNGLAAALANQGKLREAQTQYARVLELDPGNDSAKANLARLGAALENAGTAGGDNNIPTKGSIEPQSP